jgi:hypothetical protein
LDVVARTALLHNRVASKPWEDAMQCGACGQVVADGSTVCGNCGAAVASDPGRVPATGQAPLARLVERVKAILLTPKTEWPRIAAEPATAQDIYLRYVAPLAAIGVVASFLGQVLVGIPVPMLGTVRVGVGAGIAAAIVHFLLTFASVFIVAMIVDALAPTFGGQKNPLAALKVTAYSFTAAWVAAILTILPALGLIAALIGLYGLYLLYLGLPVLMRAPADRALGYTVVVVLCAIVVNIIIVAITGLVTGGLFAGV